MLGIVRIPSILVPVVKRVGLGTAAQLTIGQFQMSHVSLKLLKRLLLTVYLRANNLLPVYQSGIHRGPFTDTLLVRLLSGIYGPKDSCLHERSFCLVH